MPRCMPPALSSWTTWIGLCPPSWRYSLSISQSIGRSVIDLCSDISWSFFLWQHADSFRSRQLAELFLHVASHMKSRYRIAMIATAQQQTSIHPSLITSHLFSE